MEIAIVGAGWYGCHLALELKKQGHEVSLYEKNPRILSQTSGTFGIRLHAGPHYPRSEETRKSCLRGLEEFKIRYPDLVTPHEYSIYGLGTTDADDKPPRISEQEFIKVCQESKSAKILNPVSAGYRNLITAASIEEPSIALGTRLRTAFTRYLTQADVKINCNVAIEQLIPKRQGVLVKGSLFDKRFDKVINATSYLCLKPPTKNFPFNMEVVYQPCLALVYHDKKPVAKPFSFIVMDGWFPCIMPVCDETPVNKYILTHGKWTIMGSFNTPDEAQNLLNNLTDDWVAEHIKPFCESEINRFWPAFAERFEYLSWKGNVLAKLKTKKEFRSAIAYEKNNVIHVFPGKISNVFDVEREVTALLTRNNVWSLNSYLYVKDGVFHKSFKEISEKPAPGEPNTCNLQTYEELFDKSLVEDKLKVEPQPPKNNHFYLSCLKEIAENLNCCPNLRSISI